MALSSPSGRIRSPRFAPVFSGSPQPATYLNGKLEYDLQPLLGRHGDDEVQKLTKAHIDQLVQDLLAGGTKTAKGRTRRPWGAIAVNKFIQSTAMVLADAVRQGWLPGMSPSM